MVFALAACTGSGGAGSEVSYDIPEGKQIPDDAVLDIMTVSHASWPYDENWKVWEYIKEAIGGTINVNAVPASDFGTKVTLLVADPDSLPDVFGFQTIGTYLRVDPESVDASVSEEQAATTDFILKHTYPELDPTRYLSFSSEDATKLSDYNTTLKTFVEENLMKFIIGQRPLTEWDSFQKELSELPVDELLAVYEETYNRVKE